RARLHRYAAPAFRIDGRGRFLHAANPRATRGCPNGSGRPVRQAKSQEPLRINMKEDVLDVLMYLFEACVEADPEPAPDRSVLRGQLEEAGFRDREIEHALTWLDGLNRLPDEAAELTDRAVRVFSRQE